MKFICISGKARHGKDTCASMIDCILTERGQKSIIIHYSDLLKFMCKELFGWDGNKDEAGRSLLQKVGTDLVRERETDFWVNYMISLSNIFYDIWDYIIIPDCRFPNEINYLTNNKKSDVKNTVIHLRVVRDNFDNNLTEDQKNHISEKALDDIKPDLYIYNNRTLNDLNERIRDVFQTLS